MEANRRRELQSLLTQSLPDNVLCSFSLFQDRLLDEQAPAARAALERPNISIPTFLKRDFNHGTVYHHEDLTVRMLDAFWEAGFRDVNGLDSTGHTPLMAMNLFGRADIEKSFEIIAWFENKGVDIHENFHDIHQNPRVQVEEWLRSGYLKSGHTVLHYLCWNLSYRFQVYAHQVRAHQMRAQLSLNEQMVSSIPETYSRQRSSRCMSMRMLICGMSGSSHDS